MYRSGEHKYSLKTLIGYWKEKREREEVEQAVFLDRCMKGELMIQKMALLEETFLKSVRMCVIFRCMILCIICPQHSLNLSQSRLKPVSSFMRESGFMSSIKKSSIRVCVFNLNCRHFNIRSKLQQKRKLERSIRLLNRFRNALFN